MYQNIKELNLCHKFQLEPKNSKASLKHIFNQKKQIGQVIRRVNSMNVTSLKNEKVKFFKLIWSNTINWNKMFVSLKTCLKALINN